MALLRIGVLASGKGSNLAAIARLCREGVIPAEIVLVVSNRPSAGALGVAARFGIPAEAMPARDYDSVEQRDLAIGRRMREAGAGLLVNAGYDRYLASALVAGMYAGRVMNVHPSLLPSFAGTMHAVRDAIEHGVKVTGVTIHFVDETADGGAIILQEPVPVLEGDDEATLLERVQAVEHRLLPEAIRLFAEGRLRLEGRTVRILPAPEPVGRG